MLSSEIKGRPSDGASVAATVPLSRGEDNCREILGVTFQMKGRDGAVKAIDEAFSMGQSLAIAFANAHTLNIASEMEHFRGALRHFFVLNDGLGVDVASLVKFGQRFPENLNGTDFVPYFLNCSRHNYRIFLVGATERVALAAAREFAQQWPRHSIVGAHSGFFNGPVDIEETCRAALDAKADLVLVGMGNPLQELWISEYGGLTGAKLLIGVGALFDFVTKEIPRAPVVVRKLRCEWIFRLALEPRRLWRRYVVGNAVFMKKLLIEVVFDRGST